MITHTINLVRSLFRAKGKRSNKWKAVEKHFLENNPTCAGCGGRKHLQIHHIKPFHVFPEDELNTSNLITLCMGKKQCHYLLGHGRSWKSWNQNVVDDCKLVLAHPESFKKIAKLVEKLRMKG